jgi:hypothetical protein
MLRYDEVLQTRVPREFLEAISKAASLEFTTPSEFVRRAILRELTDKGALPNGDRFQSLIRQRRTNARRTGLRQAQGLE